MLTIEQAEQVARVANEKVRATLAQYGVQGLEVGPGVASAVIEAYFELHGSGVVACCSRCGESNTVRAGYYAADYQPLMWCAGCDRALTLRLIAG
jgi:hypothetical protein